jgi:predicted esterase
VAKHETIFYLHGAWTNAQKSLDPSRFDLVPRLAGGGDVIAFDAPFYKLFAPDKHYWFLNPEGEFKNHNPLPEIRESSEFIVSKLQESGRNPLDLTIVGLSQGGFMALYLTLNNIIIPKKTIAVVPFYSRDLVKYGAENLNKTTPILWAAAGRDERLPKYFSDTWSDLLSLSVNLTYMLSPGSRHGRWTKKFKNDIIRWSRQH